jgi:CRISPR/Cas system-associated protein Csm6
MGRKTEKEIAQKLKRWSQLQARAGRIVAEREQSLEPIRTRFEQRCAPINQRAQARLDPIQQEISTLEAEITALMEAGISASGDIRFTRVAEATAVAEVITHTQREIDAKTFFESVPAAERTKEFWSCLKTLVIKAEKFLGERVNTLAHAKRTHRISIHSQEQSR